MTMTALTTETLAGRPNALETLPPPAEGHLESEVPHRVETEVPHRDPLLRGFPSRQVGASHIIFSDGFNWLDAIPENSLHAIVTDPPYGVKEYELEQIELRKGGTKGIWRLPPVLNGVARAPLPRFTALTPKERAAIRTYFVAFAEASLRALRPGGHMFLASNAFLSQLVFSALIEGGMEFRTEMIRLVRTLRGGDRPKGAEQEFSDVCSLPGGCYEPWGILRKPLPAGMTVADCLREYGTGGLRRTPDGGAFLDVIQSERTPKRERAIANHPSIKPQSLMRQIVHAALPMGVGVVADPFMGSGATVAAAEAIGVRAIGVERHMEFYDMATDAVPRLAALPITPPKKNPQMEFVDMESESEE